MSIFNGFSINRALKGTVVSIGLVALLGCGGGGGGGDSVSESDRIASALVLAQEGLSIESLDGIWLVYSEEAYDWSDSDSSAKYNEAWQSRAFVHATTVESGAVVFNGCNNRFFAEVSADAKNINLRFHGGLGLTVSDNLKMTFDYKNAVEVERGDVVESINGWMYKVSDSVSDSIGEFFLGDFEGDATCLKSVVGQWTENGTDEGQSFFEEGSWQEFDLAGDLDLSLNKYQYSGSFGDESDVSVELNGENYRGESGFTVTTVSPTEFDLSVILDENSPEMTGEVLIYSGALVE